ncbi:MAG: hypothetical protein Q9181_005678 [Wetmoreana brouardii]
MSFSMCYLRLIAVLGLAACPSALSAVAASPRSTDAGPSLQLNPIQNSTLGNNFAVQCNGVAYGRDLNIASCREAQGLIPISDKPLKFGQRGRMGLDVQTPWRWISSDGQCAIEVPETPVLSKAQGSYLDLATAAEEMAEICLEYKDHPEGSSASNIGEVLDRILIAAKQESSGLRRMTAF